MYKPLLNVVECKTSHSILRPQVPVGMNLYPGPRILSGAHTLQGSGVSEPYDMYPVPRNPYPVLRTGTGYRLYTST